MSSAWRRQRLNNLSQQAQINRLRTRLREVSRSRSTVGRSETVVKMVSGESTVMLNARSYGALGDGIADDTVALKQWLDDQVATGRAGYLPAGLYRVTSSLNYRDTPAHLSIHGDGARQSILYGDFVGAGQGILDLSDATRKSGFHRVIGLGFIGNGVPGDPVGILLEHAWSCVLEDISAPNVDGKVLANSLLLVTKDNNSKFRNIHTQSGWQPKAFTQSPSARASWTTGGTTITSDTDVFSAAMVGQPIYLADGSATSSHLIWTATITGFTSPTQVVVDVPAPSTMSGVKFRVGHITGSVTAGSTQLVINNIEGLTADWVGMLVNVLGAATKSTASNKPGLLSARIAAVSGNTITLDATATVAVTNAIVLFAPPIFVGDLQGDPSSLRTNHSWWSDVHIEGFSAAGLIVNSAVYVVFDRLKLHGANYTTAGDWGECYFGAVVSEVESLTMRDIQANYTIMGTKFHVSGSYGAMVLDDVELAHLRPDTPAVKVVDPDISFRLMLGKFHTADLVGFASDYKLFDAPMTAHLEMFGTTHYRSMGGKYTKTPVAPVHAGATAQHRKISIDAGGVTTWRPPGPWGTLHVVAETTGVVAIVQFRTSDSSLGATVSKLAAGTEVDVLAAATTLTGATGTAGRVTIAADSTGKLQIENRRSFGIAVALYHTPFGVETPAS